MCDHLVGLQVQDSTPPFVGLWSRIADFDPKTVSAGLEDRLLVRITVMRATIHLVTPPDVLRIAPHVQPELEKIPFRKGFNYGAMIGLDPEQVRKRGEAVLGDEPMSAADMRAQAAVLWPDRGRGRGAAGMAVSAAGAADPAAREMEGQQQAGLVAGRALARRATGSHLSVG
jgi:hypothetical protein